jgi:hypothetical protein
MQQNILLPMVQQLAETTRAQIVALKAAQHSAKDIAKLLQINIATVYKTCKRYEESGGYEDRPRSGRPPIFGKYTRHQIRRLAVSDPFISANAISAQIKKTTLPHGLPTPSRRTVNLILTKQLGLRSRRPAKKPLLLPRQRSQRRQFSTEMLQKPVEFWRRVLWTDESRFEQFSCKKTHVRRPANTRYDPKYTRPTVKHPQSVMVWGCFSAAGRGSLYFLPKNTTMNGATYLNMLMEKVPDFMEILDCNVFMQDGAPCHRSNKVKQWIKSKNYELLPWPGNSADLNPIENLWDIVKSKVAEKNPSSYDDLVSTIKETWLREVTPELCEKLALSVPKRLQLVRKSRGYASKY